MHTTEIVFHMLAAVQQISWKARREARLASSHRKKKKISVHTCNTNRAQINSWWRKRKCLVFWRRIHCGLVLSRKHEQHFQSTCNHAQWKGQRNFPNHRWSETDFSQDETESRIWFHQQEKRCHHQCNDTDVPWKASESHKLLWFPLFSWWTGCVPTIETTFVKRITWESVVSVFSTAWGVVDRICNWGMCIQSHASWFMGIWRTNTCRIYKLLFPSENIESLALLHWWIFTTNTLTRRCTTLQDLAGYNDLVPHINTHVRF